MIKLLALFAAYRLLRAVVEEIAVIATVALLVLSAMPHTAGPGSRAAGRLQHAARPLEQLLQHALQETIGP